MALSTDERARYQRHLSLEEVGVAGQEKLKAARVLVIGAGGLGSPSALYLAASGIGTLGIVDCDRVEVSNLQRQVLFDSEDVARPKAAVARERLLALNPAINVVAHDLELRAANVREVLGGYDVILDGTDRLATRYVVNDACVLLGKPLVSAAIHRFEGQVMTYVPGRGPCYRCLYADVPEGLVPNCADAGVLGVLPGVLGAVQATEAIKLVLRVGELLVGRLLVYDALELRFHEFAFPRRQDCAVCGDQPSITEPRDPPQACDAAALARVRQLAPLELRALLDAGPQLVIDVREPREFAASHLPGAVNIPLGALRERLSDIPFGAEPVFVCRSGGRSLRACGVALEAGIAGACNLEGGMLAWAAIVDPSCGVAQT